MQSALYRIKSFMLMTVRGPAERSSRFYEENVQYNDRTNKKLKCFLLHLRPPPFHRRPRGKKGLTAIQKQRVYILKQQYSRLRRILSMRCMTIKIPQHARF